MANATCSIDGCEKPTIARALCSTHYARHRRAGGIGRLCSIDGCGRPHFGRGWCEIHHDRWRRNGDPMSVSSIHGDPTDRFWYYTDATTEDGCWTWCGTVTGEGYGVMSVDGGQVKAHRYAYELLVGPIPAGLDLDHTCHHADPTCHEGDHCPHRRCVNPTHLEPVTSGENVARGNRHRTLHPARR